MRVLLCPPEFFSVDYEINPWMHKEFQVNKQLAQKQWENLKKIYFDLGVRVEVIKPIEGLPDMVFTANAGLVLDRLVIVSNFKYRERQPESKYFQAWFKKHGFQIFNLGEGEIFEGQGEALVIGNYLVAGYGFRANLSSYRKIKSVIRKELVTVKLIDSRFYHLDTCFLPLNSTTAVYFPKAFDSRSQSKLRGIIPNLISVSEQEAMEFVCNSVVVADTILMPAVSENLKKEISNLGYKIQTIEISEFKKSGGGVRCLTLNLD